MKPPIKTKRSKPLPFEKTLVYKGRVRNKDTDHPIMDGLDDYIEFALAKNCFSDAGFYLDLREHIRYLESTIERLDSIINYSAKPF